MRLSNPQRVLIVLPFNSNPEEEDARHLLPLAETVLDSDENTHIFIGWASAQDSLIGHVMVHMAEFYMSPLGFVVDVVLPYVESHAAEAEIVVLAPPQNQRRLVCDIRRLAQQMGISAPVRALRTSLTRKQFYNRDSDDLWARGPVRWHIYNALAYIVRVTRWSWYYNFATSDY